MNARVIELNIRDRPYAELYSKIMRGSIFVIRNCLKEIGLFSDLKEVTNSSIVEMYGKKIADRINQVGVENIHTILGPEEILELTEYTYVAARKNCSGFLKTFVQELFQDTTRFYFERTANVRFHMPFDLSSGKGKLFNSYIQKLGPGKINAHGPHRDSWVSQPSNIVNIWIAAGPVVFGNSLIIYPDAYKKNILRNARYIRKDENPGPGVTFNLQAGDVLLFHSEHLHSSEINSTNLTRHVISFRITFEKPHYEFGHYNRYAHSTLADGPWDKFADLPQNFAWSYVRCRTIDRVRERLTLNAKKLLEHTDYKIIRRSTIKKEHDLRSDEVTVMPTNETNAENTNRMIKTLTDSLCVAKSEDGQIIVFERFCPHQGADLSFGHLQEDSVKCPWHNLPISLKTGLSPCRSLKKLKVYPCSSSDDFRNIILQKLSL